MRSIAAVLAGATCWAMLWITATASLQAIMPGSFREDGSTDSSGILILILVLASGFHVLVGYLAATIARRREIAHALALGIVQLTIGMAVQIQLWEVMPLWYHLPFLGLIVPTCVLGGRIAADRSSRAVVA